MSLVFQFEQIAPRPLKPALLELDGISRAAVEAHSGRLIVERPAMAGPAMSLPSEEFANKDSELLACDVECRLAGVEGFYLELDIPGLDELIGGIR